MARASLQHHTKVGMEREKEKRFLFVSCRRIYMVVEDGNGRTKQEAWRLKSEAMARDEDGGLHTAEGGRTKALAFEFE